MNLNNLKISKYVYKLYDNEMKRYYLNDFKIYCVKKKKENNIIIKRNVILYAGF